MGGGLLSAGPHSEHTRRKPDCLCSQERYWNPCYTAKYLSRQRCCFNKQRHVPFLTALTKLVELRCSALNTSLPSSHAQFDFDGSFLICVGLPIASPIGAELSRTKVRIMKRFTILFSLLLVLPLCIQSQESAASEKATSDNAISKPAKERQPPPIRRATMSSRSNPPSRYPSKVNRPGAQMSLKIVLLMSGLTYAAAGFDMHTTHTRVQIDRTCPLCYSHLFMNMTPWRNRSFTCLRPPITPLALP
jgi:hypothetical protein